MIPSTMSQVIMFVVLTIFVWGTAAIIFSHVNILWRSFFGEKRNRLSPSEELTIQPIGLKVVARHDMSARHFSVRLQAINGTTLTSFLPGQFLTLITPQHSCEELKEKAASQNVLKRCYSLAAWQKETHSYELGIQRENQGKVSSWLYENLQIGTVINALPPKGRLVFDANQTQHAALVAGGIGITPLRAMVHKFIENNKKAPPSNKTMSLFYSAKSVEEMCYVNEFIQLAQEFSNFLFYPFLSHSLQPTLHTSHSTTEFIKGRISAEKIAQLLDQPLGDYHYYICGPNPMMNELKSALSEQGVATGNIYIERFGIGASPGHKRDFSVKIANHKSFTFNKQTTLLNAMEEQGIAIESECRIGECGQCKVNLVAGSVKPLIDMGYDLKSGEILPCCCVPKSDLLIKL